MSLTKIEDKDLIATRFFTNVIVPLAIAIRDSGKSFFPTGPDAKIESYYSKPNCEIMNPADFKLSAADSVEDFIMAISEFWVKEGNQELAEIAAGLTDLTQDLAHEEEQSEDVSPFIYVMF